jgi:hypothetical protein
VTRRFRQVIGLDCQSMPANHAAVRHGVSWGKARRAERAFLDEWDRARPRRRPRHLGLDEIPRGKGQQFWTILSDIVHGEVLGLRQDRTEATARTLLETELDAAKRGRVDAWTRCAPTGIVRMSTRFTRSCPTRRSCSTRSTCCGKRWLPLRRWKTVRGSKRRELEALFAVNRRLFTSYRDIPSGRGRTATTAA